MGSCLSRKKESSSSSSSLNIAASVSIAAPKQSVVAFKSFDATAAAAAAAAADELRVKKKVVEEEKVKREVVEEEGLVKKEIFVIKHRKSHDKERVPSTPTAQKIVSLAEDSANSTNTNNTAGEIGTGSCTNNISNMAVRTSSCTKEEVDAILIQCGRLSRSNSSGKVASSGRKYSGSKRSYDLDQDQDVENHHQIDAANYDARNKRGNGSYCNDDEDDEMGNERRQHRQRHRQSGRPSPSSSSQGRRRTPSCERDQRSGSRERGNGSSSSSGRRVSRSPGRRSETNPIGNSSSGTSNATSATTNNRPGKMVSVPATVSSLTMDKSNIGVEPQTTNGVKRISVKRNVGAGEAALAGTRSAASPRSQSPARNDKGGSNENNQQQQPSLSRSSSRKAEHSPYRRNPLSEIDTNSLVYAQATGNNKTANNNSSSKVQSRNKELEGQMLVKDSISVLNQANQMQKQNAETNGRLVSQGANKAVKEQTAIVEDAKLPMSTVMVASGADVKPQTLTRSRSARRSRDLDFNPENLLNPNPSYTALLLEDIQNFHQKSTTNTNTPPPFSVPACVTKACSILEAVADLNSTTGSNIVGKKVVEETKDPFVESEILVNDDLIEPSFHKYVTVRRGGGNGSGALSVEDMDGQESSGSNSFVSGSQQHWGGYSTSSWEPNSADSTDRWTSRSNTRNEEEKTLGYQKHTLSESGRDMEEARRGFSGQRNGIGRGRVSSSKNLYSTPIVAAAAST